MFDKDVLSIDLGSCNIKLLEGRQQGNAVIVSNACMVRTPANCYSDGKIQDYDGLRSYLSNALNENRIKAKKAIVTIESTLIIRRDIVLPQVKPEEMESMVRFEIEQYLPIMLNEYVVEYKVQDEFVEDDVKKCRINVAALPKSIAEEFLQLLRELRLVPVALDINSNSVSKLFEGKALINTEHSGMDKTIALIDIGCNTINLVIVSKGVQRFNRLITTGSSDIDINIANSFNMDVEQAEKKKIQECGLDKSDSIINDIAKSSVDTWIEDIRKLFQYYTSRANANRIDEMYLYGGGSNAKGMAEYFSDAFGMPAYKLSSHSNIKFNKSISSQSLEYYMNSAGAVIRK